MQVQQDGKFRKKVSFAAVSNIALRDKNLSLKAKGLYALIRSYITLDDFTLYKGYLISLSTDGLRSFNTAWDELKKFGYLKQFRIREENGFKYEYDLLDEPDLDTPATKNIKLDGSISEKESTPKKENTPNDTTDSDEKPEAENFKPSNFENIKPLDIGDTYEDILQEVNKNIEYDLCVSDMKECDISFITNIRDIIIETLLTKSKQIKIGSELKNGDEVRATLKKFSSLHLSYLQRSVDDFTENITNPKAYMLAAIYNSIKTNGIKERVCGIYDTY